MGQELERTQQAQPPALRIADRIAEIKTNVQMVQHVMRELMKPEVHYGKIPGTDKPTLLQPGAELICLTFQWAPRYTQEDLSYQDVVRYRTTCELYSRITGEFIGSGQGEASSDEEKYRWRRAVNKAEYEATAEDRRRVKIYKGGGSVEQVRIEPPDIANTVLKMSNKRALVAATRGASACSDMFAQDLEDMPAEVREGMTDEGQTAEQPKTPQTLGAAGWQKLTDQALGFGYEADSLIASAASLGFEGPPEHMPREMAKTLYRAMRDHPRPVAPEDAAPSGDKTGQDEPAAPNGGEDTPEAPAAEEREKPSTTDDTETLPGMDAGEQAPKLPSEMAAEQAAKAAERELTKVAGRKDVSKLYTQQTAHGVPDEDRDQFLCDVIGVDDFEHVPAARVDDVLAFLTGYGEGTV